MSSREEFAGVAPSGRVIMSRATTGLEVLERALAGWPVVIDQGRGAPIPHAPETLQAVRAPAPGRCRILFRTVLQPRTV